jgi:hypothetical protein
MHPNDPSKSFSALQLTYPQASSTERVYTKKDWPLGLQQSGSPSTDYYNGCQVEDGNWMGSVYQDIQDIQCPLSLSGQL